MFATFEEKIVSNKDLNPKLKWLFSVCDKHHLLEVTLGRTLFIRASEVSMIGLRHLHQQRCDLNVTKLHYGPVKHQGFFIFSSCTPFCQSWSRFNWSTGQISHLLVVFCQRSSVPVRRRRDTVWKRWRHITSEHQSGLCYIWTDSCWIWAFDIFVFSGVWSDSLQEILSATVQPHNWPETARASTVGVSSCPWVLHTSMTRLWLESSLQLQLHVVL